MKQIRGFPVPHGAFNNTLWCRLPASVPPVVKEILDVLAPCLDGISLTSCRFGAALDVDLYWLADPAPREDCILPSQKNSLAFVALDGSGW